jgi:hypothetical protein
MLLFSGFVGQENRERGKPEQGIELAFGAEKN